MTKDNKMYITVTECNKLSPRTNISLLIIIIYGVSYKRRLFGYAILIHENRQRKFSLDHLTKHSSNIYKENYLYGDLKSETFALTRGILRIKGTTQTHNYYN